MCLPVSKPILRNILPHQHLTDVRDISHYVRCSTVPSLSEYPNISDPLWTILKFYGILKLQCVTIHLVMRDFSALRMEAEKKCF
jgi:hypothetical protein